MRNITTLDYLLAEIYCQRKKHFTKSPYLIFTLLFYFVPTGVPCAQECENGSAPISQSVSIAGLGAYDGAGDPDNVHVQVCGFAPNGNITGMEWSGIDLSPISPSWCSDVCFLLESAVFFRPAIGEHGQGPCSNNYSGGSPSNLQDLGLNFPADTNGCVSIEIFDWYDDWTNAVDADIDQGTITLTGCPENMSLPMELVGFGAIVSGTGNLIFWSTAAESNSKTHIIERSPDGISGWERVGERDGAPNSTQTREYELIDAAPLLNSYYRIREISLDGQHSFSHVISLVRPHAGAFPLQIAPNPVVQELRLIISQNDPAKLEYTIFDCFGKIISSNKVYCEGGTFTLNVDVGSLAPGIYYIHLDNGLDSMKQPFVKN